MRSSSMDRAVTAIDLTPFRRGGAAERAEVARAVDEACRGTGFLAVTGHGVAPELIERMLDVTAAFFDLPLEEKLRWVNPDTAANRGYAAEGTEALSYSLGEASPPDLFEAFNVGREILPEDEDEQVVALRGSFLAPNLWPSRPAEFRATWLAYWAAMEELGCTLMRVAAVALGLAEDYFQPMIDRSISVMRAINYERSPGAPEVLPGQMRMGAHSDYGSLTILLADDVPGLEIRLADGSWQPVPIPAGGFVVNIGDLLAEWTNDRWQSTVHRVVPPHVSGSPSPYASASASASAGASGAGGDDRCRRRSVAWFQQPNHDAVVECLPTCTGTGNPPRYRPVRSGDHLMAKLMGPRLLRPSEQSPGHVEG